VISPIAESCDHKDAGKYGYLNTNKIQLSIFWTLSINLFSFKKNVSEIRLYPHPQVKVYSVGPLDKYSPVSKTFLSKKQGDG
jgi:hypothetical protein